MNICKYKLIHTTASEELDAIRYYLDQDFDQDIQWSYLGGGVYQGVLENAFAKGVQVVDITVNSEIPQTGGQTATVNTVTVEDSSTIKIDAGVILGDATLVELMVNLTV